jgi:ABC-type branched-subunit amino acid transport system ATPase component
VSAASFPVTNSVEVVAMAALGGIGLMSGPLLGALYIVGVPRFVPLDNAGLAATSIGWLILLLYVPGGLVRLVAPVRRWALGAIARHRGIEPATLDSGAPSITVVPKVGSLVLHRVEPDVRTERSPFALEAASISKRFGGVVAVDGVDVKVRSGSIVGLIGANGAGKSTLFEILGGFIRPDAGSVLLHGVDISDVRAERRAALGLVRSFQDAALFPSLTVRETVELALESRMPTSTWSAALGVDRRSAARSDEADDLIGALGLSAWSDIAVGELSTGTRRITELACVVGLRPRVLLLDEPAAGLAQPEAEALGELLLRFRDEAGATLVVIEHDIPLIMAISDEVVAMGSGRVIAEGDPDTVRTDDAVIASYLGEDAAAVERSGSRGTQ